MAKEIRLVGLTSLPEVKPKDDLGKIIVEASKREGVLLEEGDVVVVTQKIVSKAEGRLVKLDRVQPSAFALRAAKGQRKDPRLLEVILREAKRVVRMARGVILAETRHGLVCANAAVDQSNLPKGVVSLLPVNPDRSAGKIRETISKMLGAQVAVIIADTFGRPWRVGYVDVAVGVAGMKPLFDYRGQVDSYGYRLRVTMMAVADEIASAAELVMGKLDGVPVAIIKGARYQRGEGRARQLVRRPSRDLFS